MKRTSYSMISILPIRYQVTQTVTENISNGKSAMLAGCGYKDELKYG